MAEYKMTIVRIDKNENYRKRESYECHLPDNQEFIPTRHLEINLTQEEFEAIKKAVFNTFK